MKIFFNIKLFIVLLLSIIFLWYGYLFIEGSFLKKPSVSSPSNKGLHQIQSTVQQEESPQRISPKEKHASPQRFPDPEKKKALSPKKKVSQKIDFILISPNPIGIRFGYQITIQAYGFRFKETRENPPLDTDPLLPENQKSLQKKYISLGPVAVQWKNLSPNPPNPRGGCFFKIIPQKDPSKATVIPLCTYGILDPGVMAFFAKNPAIKNQGKVIIGVNWETIKHVPQKPMKIRKITIGKDGIFELWGEQGGKIYGRVFMKKGTEITGGYSRTVWDKKLLMEAFNLQNHEAFLQNIKNTLWRGVHPFIDYRFRLVITRYVSLEKGRSINLQIEQLKITKLIKDNEVAAPKVKVSPYKGPTYTEIDQAIRKQDSVVLMEVIKSKNPYSTRYIFKVIRRHKGLRNLLVYQLRDFANHYPKPKQYDVSYADLLYTLAMIGVATPEEEKLVIEYWRGTPQDWEKRYTWWRD